MSVCERCTENGNCAWQNHDETICREKPAFPITNYDRVRAMSVEEMAEWIGKVTAGGYGMCAPGHYDCTGKESCAPCWLDWLKEAAAE
jgi:hypothetical protein